MHLGHVFNEVTQENSKLKVVKDSRFSCDYKIDNEKTFEDALASLLNIRGDNLEDTCKGYS